MAEQDQTLEQIEQEIREANLEQYERDDAGAGSGGQQDLASITAQFRRVCGVYRGIRSVLRAILSIPLIPGSIKAAIRSFMSVMDSVCR